MQQELNTRHCYNLLNLTCHVNICVCFYLLATFSTWNVWLIVMVRIKCQPGVIHVTLTRLYHLHRYQHHLEKCFQTLSPDLTGPQQIYADWTAEGCQWKHGNELLWDFYMSCKCYTVKVCIPGIWRELDLPVWHWGSQANLSGELVGWFSTCIWQCYNSLTFSEWRQCSNKILHQFAVWLVKVVKQQVLMYLKLCLSFLLPNVVPVVGGSAGKRQL